VSTKTLVLAAIVLIPFRGASAQTLQPRPGDRVRITATSVGLTNQVARVQSVRNDTLILRLRGDETQTVPLAAVSHLELSTRRTRHTLQGAGIGGLVGAGIGLVGGYASGDDDPNQFMAMSAGGKAALGAMVLGVAGLAIGSVVGALHVTDQWTSLPLGDTRAAPNLELGTRGARLGLSISF